MKKTKLFLSLCMMCLCVAVLCMGILAASSATYNINGNISYNMIDGVALVNTRVYKVAGTTTESDLSTKCTELSSKSFEEIERISDPYYILSQKLDSQPLINTSSETSSSSTTSIDIKYGAIDSVIEYYTYYVVIAIKNVSTDTNYFLNAYFSTLGTSTISSIASNANGSSDIVEIKSGAYSNIVIGLSYTGTTTTAETFNYTLNVSYNKRHEFNDLLANYTDENNNNYWYVALGTLSDGTAIRWRVVSLDGTNKYTYTSTKPTVRTGTVFLQETYLGSAVSFGSSDGNNYYNSSIRTTINTLSTWNIQQESDISTLITKRNITSITDGTDPPITAYSGTTDDYFWLLSKDEVDAFMATEASVYQGNTDRIWTPHNYGSAVSWWTLTPRSGGFGGTYRVCADGSFYGIPSAPAIRAAFQLA